MSTPTKLQALAIQLDKQIAEVRKTQEAIQAQYNDEAFDAYKSAHEAGTYGPADKLEREANGTANACFSSLSWVLSNYSAAVRGCAGLTTLNSLGTFQSSSNLDCQLAAVSALRSVASSLRNA